MQKGANLITITPVPSGTPERPAKLNITILTRTESYRPSTKLWTWKPPEADGKWLTKYEASVFVKSRTSIR